MKFSCVDRGPFVGLVVCAGGVFSEFKMTIVDASNNVVEEDNEYLGIVVGISFYIREDGVNGLVKIVIHVVFAGVFEFVALEV